MLSKQLKELRPSVTSVFDVSDTKKKKKSLIREDGGRSVTRADALRQSKAAWEELCRLDAPRFEQFRELFSDVTVDLVVELQSAEQWASMRASIRHLLCVIGGLIDDKNGLVALEWLVSKYQAHIHQPDDLVMAALPFHDQPIFVKYAQLIVGSSDSNKERFEWLRDTAESGRLLSIEGLARLCVRNRRLLETICTWPGEIVKIEESLPGQQEEDEEESGEKKRVLRQEMCHFLKRLSLEIIKHVHENSRKPDQIRAQINPIARMIQDGLDSNNDYFVAVSIQLAVYLSENVQFPLQTDSFLTFVIDRLLEPHLLHSIIPLVRCRSLIHVWTHQQFPLDDDTRDRFVEMAHRITDERQRQLVQLDIDQTGFPIDQASSTVLELQQDQSVPMEVTEEKKPQEKLAKDRRIVKRFLEAIGSIEPDDEAKMIELVDNHVAIWIEEEEMKSRSNPCRNKLKIPMAIIDLLMKKKSGNEDEDKEKEEKEEKKEQVKEIAYCPGGLVSHLCVALAHPDSEIRKSIRDLIKVYANKSWSNRDRFFRACGKKFLKHNNIRKNSSICLIILEEIDHLLLKNNPVNFATIKVTCLSLVNEEIIGELAAGKYPNVWTLFCDTLREICCSNDITKLVYLNVIRQSIKVIGVNFPNLPIDRQQSILTSITEHHETRNSISVAVEILSSLTLSLANYQYLLREDNRSTTEEEGEKKKESLTKFNSSSSISQFYSQNTQLRIETALSAFVGESHSRISLDDQLVLINTLVPIIKRTVIHLSKTEINKEQACKDEGIISFTTSVMNAINMVLSTAILSDKKIDTGSFSNKFRLEDFIKCLYLFENIMLNERTLSVIQNIVKLGMGSENFDLIYFISWIGNYLVPREDENSLKMLDSIIRETIPICIKQKKDSQCDDKVKIMITFIEESVVLPKHRLLLLFKSLVMSLSESSGNKRHMQDIILWIQLVFMLAIKSTKACKEIQNESLIIPLLKEFSFEEQIYSLNTMLSFLCFFLHDPSRKRKRNESDTDSPISKKRKTSLSSVQMVNKGELNTTNLQSVNDNGDFSLVKQHLMNLKIEPLPLLTAMIKYCEIYLKGSSDQLLGADSDVVKSFISCVFVSIRSISKSGAPDKQKNELCKSLRHLIEYSSSSMDVNDYLSMIIRLTVSSSNDDTLRSKCLELLANKLSTIANKVSVNRDQKMTDVFLSILPLIKNIIINELESPDWKCCLLCASSFVSLEFTSLDKSINAVCLTLYSHLLNSDLCKLSSEKIVVANLYLKHFITSELCDELQPVLKYCLDVFDKCFNNVSSITNGVLESNLAVVYSIVCRPDIESIDWEHLTQLNGKLFELVSVEGRLSRTSKQSIEYQKQIRLKLCKLSDTKSLIDCCVHLSKKGIERRNLMFVSGSVNLFGCHMKHLNQLNIKYVPEESDSDSMWDLIYHSFSVKEQLKEHFNDNWKVIEKISAKAVTQLCHHMEFDEDILRKLFTWCKQSDITPQFYIERVSTVYRFVSCLISGSGKKDEEKVIELINGSDVIPVGNYLLKYLSIESKSARKKRKSQINSSITVPFSSEDLVNQYPKECGEMIRSISSAILSHLRLEKKCGMNLSVSDETIDLISTVCRCIVSIDQYLDKDDYENTCNKHLSPLIIQMAANSSNDEALLRPLAIGLCKQFSDLSASVHLVVLRTLSDLKLCLGDLFESSIRENVASFLEDCQLHDDEDVSQLAEEI